MPSGKAIAPPSVIELLRRVVRKKYEIEKVPHKFGTEHLLFSAEIFLLEVIGQGVDLSVTETARRMGITKGAVSQTLRKLLDKGLVQKTAAPLNNSRAVLKLTPKGQRAWAAHERWHRDVDGGFNDYLASLNREQLSLLIEFLSKLETFLDKRKKLAE